MSFSHDTYISPLTWRYGSSEMRAIWSESHKRRLMRRVWLALATAQHQAGLVSAAQLTDLQAHVEQVDFERSAEIERQIRHDVMAEIRVFAEQCPVGGGIIHLGATSADITDNVDVLRQRSSVRLLVSRLASLLRELADRIEATATMPVMAFTHIQPAEPTTLGYRFAVYAQDLLQDYETLQGLVGELRGKGLKGAVGTQAGFVELLQDSAMSTAEMEAVAMAELGLPYFPVATQTYSRRQDLLVQQSLAGLAATLHKLALDFRILQSPAIGEWTEAFGEKQVGSSAMPFKRNPIDAENLCSLARFVASFSEVAWANAGQAILERSLDDSANRRLFQAEAFLVTDEMLRRAERLLRDVHIDEHAIRQNLERYGPFAGTERVLLALVQAGANRQDAHEWIRRCSLQAWSALRGGAENPLAELLANDEHVRQLLSRDQVLALLAAEGHVGTAPERALALSGAIRRRLAA